MFNQENEPHKPVSSSANSPLHPHPQISEEDKPPAIDKMKMQMLMNSLKENQNLSMGVLVPWRFIRDASVKRTRIKVISRSTWMNP